MYERSKTVCFTGHRTLYEPRQEVERRLETVVRSCIANGARTFITGGAVGFDTVAAQLILRLRSLVRPNSRHQGGRRCRKRNITLSISGLIL